MGRYEQNIVLDLEFTAVDKEKRTRGFGREIIQIGAVRIAPDGAVLDSFSAYVRPEFASRVSPKVQALTGIRICDVSNADSLEVVLGAFRQWVGQASTRFVAWSGSDLAQLSQETAYKQLAFPEGDGRWMDLQVVYPRVMGVGEWTRHVAAQCCQLVRDQSVGGESARGIIRYSRHGGVVAELDHQRLCRAEAVSACSHAGKGLFEANVFYHWRKILVIDGVQARSRSCNCRRITCAAALTPR